MLVTPFLSLVYSELMNAVMHKDRTNDLLGLYTSTYLPIICYTRWVLGKTIPNHDCVPLRMHVLAFRMNKGWHV